MTKSKPNDFILSCVSKLFKVEELLNMNPRDLDTDPRVLNIRSKLNKLPDCLNCKSFFFIQKLFKSNMVWIMNK